MARASGETRAAGTAPPGASVKKPVSGIAPERRRRVMKKMPCWRRLRLET